MQEELTEKAEFKLENKLKIYTHEGVFCYTFDILLVLVYKDAVAWKNVCLLGKNCKRVLFLAE